MLIGIIIFIVFHFANNVYFMQISINATIRTRQKQQQEVSASEKFKTRKIVERTKKKFKNHIRFDKLAESIEHSRKKKLF